MSFLFWVHYIISWLHKKIAGAKHLQVSPGGAMRVFFSKIGCAFPMKGSESPFSDISKACEWWDDFALKLKLLLYFYILKPVYSEDLCCRNIVDLQCCLNFCYLAKWFNCMCVYMCVYVFFFIFSSIVVCHDTEYSSPWGPWAWSTLYQEGNWGTAWPGRLPKLTKLGNGSAKIWL